MKSIVEEFPRLIEQHQEAREKLTELLNSVSEEACVVVAPWWVNVGYENGLNETCFYPKSPTANFYAQVWPTAAEAEKQGMDYYLVDNTGTPIITHVQKAREFFAESLEQCDEVLDLLLERANKSVS